MIRARKSVHRVAAKGFVVEPVLTPAAAAAAGAAVNSGAQASDQRLWDPRTGILIVNVLYCLALDYSACPFSYVAVVPDRALYLQLVAMQSKFDDTISRDINRTFPSHVLFKGCVRSFSLQHRMFLSVVPGHADAVALS